MNEKLTNWSVQHAILMSIAIGAGILERSTLLVGVTAAGSFFGLLMRLKGQYTPFGHFGPANAITLVRLIVTLSMLVMPVTNPLWLITLIWLLVGADGLDGWMARRCNSASDFGQLLDNETDAILLLVACMLLYLSGRLGEWILIPGVLRYLFVFFIHRVRRPVAGRTVRGNWLTRSIGVIATLVLATCLFPGLPPAASALLGGGVAVVITGSFLYSLSMLYLPESRMS
jgi:phosphatidylglycerophosphate synthase